MKSLKQKKDSIDRKFVRIYNRQGHYSASQSLDAVYGKFMGSIARVFQCILCCQCLGCRIKDSVDSKRFLINMTKLLSMIFLCINLFFISMTLNE